jgi:hypothetical protein
MSGGRNDRPPPPPDSERASPVSAGETGTALGAGVVWITLEPLAVTPPVAALEQVGVLRHVDVGARTEHVRGPQAALVTVRAAGAQAICAARVLEASVSLRRTNLKLVPELCPARSAERVRTRLVRANAVGGPCPASLDGCETRRGWAACLDGIPARAAVSDFNRAVRRFTSVSRCTTRRFRARISIVGTARLTRVSGRSMGDTRHTLTADEHSEDDGRQRAVHEEANGESRTHR